MISRIDHVNIVTPRLEQMVRFYTETLGFETGWRPDFGINGAWLYSGGNPIIHLVDRPETTDAPEGRIEHYALAASDKAALLERLEAMSVEFRIAGVPGTGAESVNFADPDSNHIEVIIGETTPLSA